MLRRDVFGGGSGVLTSVCRLALGISSILLAAVPADAQTFAFQGRVYSGDLGDEGTPIAGVTVALHGANNPYPDPGTLIQSTTTDGTGWYRLEAPTGFEYYHIVESTPQGYDSVGATSVDGVVRTADWIEYAIPLEGKTLSGNKFWDRSSATAEEFTFQGRVYRGDVGDESHPLAGVAVSVRGANDPYPSTGTLLASTTTNGAGWFGLTVTDSWEYYHIVESNPADHESVGATTVDGIVRTSDWIEFAHPLNGKTLTGNKFFDIQSSGPTPTPTPTVTPTPGGGATTVTFCAVADAELDQGSPNSNSGDGAELRVGYGQGQNEPFANRILARFDLSFIPAGTQVESARLEMRMLTADGASPVEIAAFVVRQPWDESTVTWNTQPAVDAAEVARRAVDLSVPNVHEWNLRDLVQEWVNGSTDNNGILLRGPEGPSTWRRVFDSRHYTSFCPRLVVTLATNDTIPTPTPTPTATPTATPSPTCPQTDLGGNSFSAAVAIGDGQVVEEYICPSGDVDWFKLPIEASQEIRVFLWDLPRGPDADLDVFLVDPNGGYRASSEIFGADKGGYINYTAWMTGDWRVMVKGKGVADWSKTKTYKLRVDLKFNCDQKDEAGDTFQSATEILPSLPAANVIREHTGYICPQNDVDYYKFFVSPLQTVSITAKLSDLPADFDLDLYSPDGTKVDSSTYSGSTDETVSASTSTQGGYWRVKVYGAFGVYHSWPYTLEVSLGSNADLTVEGIEVTQGIQDLSNSVDLARGKTTVARVYVDPGASVNGAMGVEVELHGWYYDWGVLRPFSDSPRKLGPMFVTNHTLENDKRLSPGESFNFFLPASWTKSGDIRLMATVNPSHTVPESNHSNNSLTVNRITIRPTATLNIGFVPVDTNGLVPTITNNADVSAMLAWFRASFPVGQIKDWYMVGSLKGNYNLNDTSGGGCGSGWRDLLCDLEDIYDSWSSRPPNASVYGLLDPGVPAAWGGCGSPSTRSAAGFVGANEGDTLAHEVGHVYKRKHAPSDRNAAGAVTNTDCTNPANEDLSYPQYTSPTGAAYARSSIGEVGLNVFTGTTFDPTTTYDLMSYCSPEWISPYNWEGIANNIPMGTKAGATTEQIEQILVSGRVNGGGCELRQFFWVRERAAESDEDTQTGPYTIELRSASGEILGSRQFDITDPADDVDRASGLFREWLPYANDVATIAIVYQGSDIAVRGVSAHPPTVTLTSPSGGDSWGGSGTERITWQAADADSDTLAANVLISADNGLTWRPLAVNLAQQFFDVDLSTVPGGNQMLVKIEVSDGVNTTSDISDVAFSADEKAPTPLLLAPEAGKLVRWGEGVAMAGGALDPQQGTVEPGQLSWYSSIDGALGTSGEIAASGLSCGAHEITLEAEGDGGVVGSASTEVTVHGGCSEGVYVVPATAHVRGLEETSWVSDLVLHNPGAQAVMAILYFLDDGVRVSNRYRVEVPGDESVMVADLLAEGFGPDAQSGGVLVGASGPLMLSSRTYNDAEDGTYGQYVPVPVESEAVIGSERATLIQLTRNEEYRTNVGFTNLGGTKLEIVVDVYASAGSHIGSKGYGIDPYSFLQVTDILHKVGADDIDDAYAVVHARGEDAAYFTYATIVDNRTGDPIYASPAQSSATPLVVSAAAHLRGANNTNWRTDLELYNSGDTQARFQIDLLKRGRDNSSPENQIFLLGPRQSVRYEDVLDTVFSYSGAASIRITPIEGEIAATSRTYNLLDTGTTGQFAPATSGANAIAQGDEARLIQLSQSTEPRSGYRTNIGFTSLSSRPSTIDVDLYNASGDFLGRVSVELEPYEHMQVDKIFNRVTSEAIDNGYAVISSTSEGALFMAYGSVTDNRSGDPIYIPAQVAAESGAGASSSSTVPDPRKSASPSGTAGIALAGGLTLLLVNLRRRHATRGGTLFSSPREPSPRSRQHAFAKDRGRAPAGQPWCPPRRRSRGPEAFR